MVHGAVVVGGGIAGIQAAPISRFRAFRSPWSRRAGGSAAASPRQPQAALSQPAAGRRSPRREDPQLHGSGARCCWTPRCGTSPASSAASRSPSAGPCRRPSRPARSSSLRRRPLRSDRPLRLRRPAQRHHSEELERAFCEGADLSLGGAPPRSAAFLLCVGSRESQALPAAPATAADGDQAGARAAPRASTPRSSTATSGPSRPRGGDVPHRPREGVLFVRVPPDRTVEVSGDGRAEVVRCFDELLGRQLEVTADLVVLSVGMRRGSRDRRLSRAAQGQRRARRLLPRAPPELAPVETAVEGVFLAGTVQGPKDIVDTVAQASAAAAKASVLLAHDQVRLDPAVATVDPERCRGCGECVSILPVQAPQLTETAPGQWTAPSTPPCARAAAPARAGARRGRSRAPLLRRPDLGDDRRLLRAPSGGRQ